MQLICKPPGRGNWSKVLITIIAPPQLFPTLRERILSPGMVIDFAGQKLRICSVKP